MKSRIKFIFFFIVCISILCGCSKENTMLGIEREKTLELESFPVEVCNTSDYIYFVGEISDSNNGALAYNIYRMDLNDYRIEKMDDFDLNKNTVVEKVAAINKDLYFLVHDEGEKPQYVIWKIDDTEKIIAKYDISRWVNPIEDAIRFFCVDVQGRCYMRSGTKPETILFDMNTQTAKIIPDLNENVSYESMAIGSNGTIFMLFCRELSIGGGYEIVELIGDQMEVIYCGELLPYNDIYSVMGTGNNEFDVFIKGTHAVYGFAKEKSEAELIAGLALEEYQYTKSYFLEGKHLLIFGMNPQIDNQKIVNKAEVLLMDLGEK